MSDEEHGVGAALSAAFASARSLCRRSWGRGTSFRVVSPGMLVACAFAIALTYCVLHLAGLREHVGFLSGTPPARLWAVVYVLAHLAFVALVPALLIAAAVFAAAERLVTRRRRKAQRTTLGGAARST